ncbi:hypothetical protein [Stenotrophomonas rhizophila]|nr:hypothetical protein [Stenotrophomonas rhizophila]
MNLASFLAGVLAGGGIAAIVTTLWLEYFNAAHFEQLLQQIRSQGGGA